MSIAIAQDVKPAVTLSLQFEDLSVTVLRYDMNTADVIVSSAGVSECYSPDGGALDAALQIAVTWDGECSVLMDPLLRELAEQAMPKNRALRWIP